MLSPMYFLLPIPGFFFGFMLIDWADKFVGKKIAHNWWFGFVILGISFFAFVIAYFYASKPAEKFFSSLLESAYLWFVLACIAGWIAHLVSNKK